MMNSSFIAGSSYVCLLLPSVIWLHPGHVIFLTKLPALSSRSLSLSCCICQLCRAV